MKTRMVIMPENILCDETLSRNALRVYGLLCSYADRNDGSCFPSRKTMGEKLKIAPAKIFNYLKELIDKGYITREFRHRDNGTCTSNRYTIVGYVELFNQKIQDNQGHQVDYPQNGDSIPNLGIVTIPKTGIVTIPKTGIAITTQYNYPEEGKRNDGACAPELACAPPSLTKEPVTEPAGKDYTPERSSPLNVVHPKEHIKEKKGHGNNIDSQKPSEPRPETSKTRKSKNDYSAEFEALWEIYPPGAGGIRPDKMSSYHCFNARLLEGEKLEVIKTGLINYRSLCDREGRTNGKYVKNPKTFFGPNKPYLDYQVLASSMSTRNNHRPYEPIEPTSENDAALQLEEAEKLFQQRKASFVSQCEEIRYAA